MAFLRIAGESRLLSQSVVIVPSHQGFELPYSGFILCSDDVVEPAKAIWRIIVLIPDSQL
jgi:hypothetical protein